MNDVFTGPPDPRDVKSTVLQEVATSDGRDVTRYDVRLEDATEAATVQFDLSRSAGRDGMEEAIEGFANGRFSPKNRLHGIVAVYEATGPFAVHLQPDGEGLTVIARRFVR